MGTPRNEAPKQRRWPRTIGLAALGLVTAYVFLNVAVAFAYRNFVMPGKRREATPRIAGGDLLRIETADAPAVFALYVKAKEGQPTLVMFHGNGEDLVDEAPLARAYADAGVGVLSVEYPGYGLARDQTANEASLYRAGEIAIQKLDAMGVDRSQRVLVGYSLGTGVATELASRGLASRLVLLAPFTSIPDMVRRFVPIVPVDWIVRDRFDSIAKAPTIAVPTLIVHGDSDRLIPVRMGEQLAASFRHAELYVVRGGHHNDLYATGHALHARVVAFARGEASHDDTD